MEARRQKREQTVKKYDGDKSKELEAKELKRLLQDSVGKAHTILDEDVEYYMKTCDKDGNGGIDAEELDGLLYNFHCWIELKYEAEDMIEKYDARQKDGCLDMEELEQVMVRINGGSAVRQRDVQWVMSTCD